MTASTAMPEHTEAVRLRLAPDDRHPLADLLESKGFGYLADQLRSPPRRPVSWARCTIVAPLRGKGPAHGLRVLIDGPNRRLVPAQHMPLPCLADAFTLGYIEDRMRDAWVGARIEINTDPWRDEPTAEVRICPAPGVLCRSFFGLGPLARAHAIVSALLAAPDLEDSP